MAKNTKKELRNEVLYSIFVRNYSEEGTFEGVRRDLKRIKDLGVDIIWLMPIHPTGEKNRKGSLGSPYAIKDYRAINPEFGTLEDFKRLVDDIHALGMKCIIDVVYNHTSPDSVLSIEHPEWFYHKKDGSFGNRVGDWWDVIDLDYGNEALWDYQIETLKYWASIVDGFRCDVASIVPIEFWKRARKEVAVVCPDALWLAESVEMGFINYLRSINIDSSSDSQIFSAFDISYDYDIFEYEEGYLTGKNSLSDYLKMVNLQEGIYPDNYDKLRFIENHDRARAHFLIKDEKALDNWTAFTYFQKGTTMLYAGQEKAVSHTPTLFDKDPVKWTGNGSGGSRLDLTPLMQKLYNIKKDPVFTDSNYKVLEVAEDTVLAFHEERKKYPEYDKSLKKIVGIFSLKGKENVFCVDGNIIPDGIYKNLLDGSDFEVFQGKTASTGRPVIIKVN